MKFPVISDYIPDIIILGSFKKRLVSRSDHTQILLKSDKNFGYKATFLSIQLQFSWNQ